MIVGLDRAIKPVWIHETLSMAKPGIDISELKKMVMDALIEISGKEARSKIFTVIARYFIDTQKVKGKRVVVKSPLLYLVKEHSMEELIPIYLATMMIRGDSIRYVTEILYKRYGDRVFEKDVLRNEVYDKYGYRKVSKAFISAYTSTLKNFGVLESIEKNKLAFKFPIPLTEFQKIIILGLHIWYMHANPITLDEFFSNKYTSIFSWGDMEKILKRDWSKYGIRSVIRNKEMFVYLDNRWYI